MSTPHRIQLSRKAGWRKPDGAVVVARPTRWGNPFVVWPKQRDPQGRAVMVEHVVERFREYLQQHPDGKRIAQAAREQLRGKDLACWCPLGQPCHADVLLEIANA